MSECRRDCSDMCKSDGNFSINNTDNNLLKGNEGPMSDRYSRIPESVGRLLDAPYK